ncbi:MAG TPA: hypothetical protein VIO61_16230 [Anaerolineaceae bacterium]
MTTLQLTEDQVYSLIREAQREGIPLRLLGGIAVWMHCPHASSLELRRDYADVDFMTDKGGGRKLKKFLPARGFIPNRQLNTLNGDRRQLYYDQDQQGHIDIFVGTFEMCHRLPMNERLFLEPLTIPLAELFLSKAQIIELNHKDVLDLFALLLDHPVGHGDYETINVDRIVKLCSKDWGLYKTLMITMQKLRKFLDEDLVNLTPDQKHIISERLNTIQRAVDGANKSLPWRVRATLGTRVRWYDEVEEIRR